ncbi:putative ribonuclease H-like domain-containing protein [Tanacetum coccineum]
MIFCTDDWGKKGAVSDHSVNDDISDHILSFLLSKDRIGIKEWKKGDLGAGYSFEENPVQLALHIKSGSSKFNTGKHNFNSGSVHFNTARVNQPGPLEDYQELIKVGSVTFGEVKICDNSKCILMIKECFVVSSDFKMLMKLGLLKVLGTHMRLGHLNFKNLNKLVKDNLVRGLPSKSFKNDHTCVACQKGKQHKASCKAKIDRYVTHPLHTLHMDLFGPTSVRSINHASYCLVITDDYSRFCWVFFLAKKDETSDILKTFVRQIENQLNQKVKIIRSDNGTEFKNRVMLEFCGEKGIKQEFSNARTPQQNGVAERMNRTLIEAARTMLADSLLPTTFWAEAVNTACYTFNRVRVTKPQNKTPYELLFGHKPILSYIRPFGCHVTILNTLSPLGKFDGKSDEGFLVGYSVNSKAFRVYNLVTKRVEVNLHVNFLEEKPNVQGLGHRWMFDLDYLTDSMNYIPVSLQNQANPAGSKEVIDIDVQTEEAEELLVVSSTSRKAAGSEHNATKKSHSSKEPSSTPISKSADDIMVFRKELDALALKHLGPVPTKTPTSTNPVNTGSGNLNTGNEQVSPGHIEAVAPSAHNVEEVFSDDDDDEMPEIRIYDKSSEEAVNTACYTFNRVRVTKPQNKTPYELLFGHKPILSYIRPFGCHVTILNTLSPLGKFDGKSDEGFLVGYSVNSKAFRVYNLVTKRVEVNFHVNFLEEKPNVQGLGHRWMFDLDYLTDSMNYIPVSLQNQANPAGSKEVIDIDVQTEEVEELLVVSSTSRKAAVSDNIATKKTHSSKKSSSTPISKSADDIMVFRKELDALALKHLGPVPTKAPTSTIPVNTGSGNLNTGKEQVSPGNMETVSPSAQNEEEVFSDDDDDEMPEIRIYDDIIFGSTNKSWCDEFEALMQSRFQMSSMGELTFFLGLQVKQKKEGIFISQEKYVAEILKKFDLVHVKAAITPMETKLPLTKDEEAFDVDVHLYRSMIGSLMYLTASRPDIMYAVCVCSRFQVTPKTSHLNAVKRIFKYLKGKPNLGLWYPRDSPLNLEAFSDSDYGGSNLDRKSTTGGCQFLGQRLISWQCKKQTIVATSTTEAEYVAAANCCGQVLWVQNQLLDYGFNFMNTKIHIDNESTICIVKNPVYHSKTKHIEIRHHFIRDCYEKKLISVEKIHTDLNVADLLTKPFDGPRFNYLVVSIGTTWCLKRVMQDQLARQGKRKSPGVTANWMQFGSQQKWVSILNPMRSIGYSELVDFPEESKLRYALTHNPPIYDSLIKQFWQTATARTLADGTQQLNATIDTIEHTITEESVRRQLQLADASGIHMLQNEEIFEGIAISWVISKSGGWDQFGSNIAIALICLSTGRDFNFSNLFFDGCQPQSSADLNTSQSLIEKVKSIENKLRRRGKSKEAKDAENQDQEILNIVASEGLRDQSTLVAKIYKRKSKSTKTPTKILHFEEPDSAQVNTGEVNAAEVNTGEVNAAEVNTERAQRRKGKEPMTEEDLQAEVQASKTSKELQELADLEEAKRVQAEMGSRLNRSSDSAEIDSTRRKGALILLRERAMFLHGHYCCQRKFLAKTKESKRRKHGSSLTREDDDLKICLHISPDEDKVIDVESLDHQYPIIEWQSFFLTTKPQHDQTKPDEDIYLNKVTRSNGHQRFFRTLMGVLSILDREDLKVIYELVMEEYKDRLPEGFDRMLWGDLMIMFNQGDTADFWDTQQDWKLISWKLHSSSGVHTIMTSTGLVFHMLVESKYPLTKEVLSQMLELKLETEEESSMALELIKFVRIQLEEFEDSNDDDTVTSTHEDEERV